MEAIKTAAGSSQPKASAIVVPGSETDLKNQAKAAAEAAAKKGAEAKGESKGEEKGESKGEEKGQPKAGGDEGEKGNQ